MITDALNVTAPIIKYQVKPKQKSETHLSANTQKLIIMLKDQKKIARNTKLPEDLRAARNLKNLVKSEKFKDRTLHYNNTIRTQIKESNLWNTVNKNYKDTPSAPKVLVKGDSVSTSPTDIANMINQSYLDKIKRLKLNIPFNSEDPMKTFRKLIPKTKNIFEMKEISIKDMT